MLSNDTRRLEAGLKPWMEAEAVPSLVSIIIPTFNREGMIVDTLDSIAAQSYRPLEVVVIDDGSTDDTVETVHQWERYNADATLNLIFISKRNGGAPSARNAGLRVCRGEYIQFFDSDDILLPHKIEDQVLALQLEPKAFFAWSRSVGTSMDAIEEAISNASVAYQGVPYRSTVQVPGAIARGIFRRAACAMIGPWNEELIRYQDWEYGVRYSALGYQSLSSVDVGYLIGVHAGPRINQINNDTDKVLDCVQVAASSAIQAAGASRSLATSVMIAQLCSYGMLRAIDAGRMQKGSALIEDIRDCLPFMHKVRLKNEIAFRMAQIVGPYLTSILVRAVASN